MDKEEELHELSAEEMRAFFVLPQLIKLLSRGNHFKIPNTPHTLSMGCDGTVGYLSNDESRIFGNLTVSEIYSIILKNKIFIAVPD